MDWRDLVENMAAMPTFGLSLAPGIQRRMNEADEDQARQEEAAKAGPLPGAFMPDAPDFQNAVMSGPPQEDAISKMGSLGALQDYIDSKAGPAGNMSPDMQKIAMALGHKGAPVGGLAGLMSKLDAANAENMKMQQEGISSLQDRLNALTSKPQQTASPLQQMVIGLADMWGGGGGKFAQEFRQNHPELDPRARQEAIDKLEDTLRKSKQDLSSDQIKMLKLQLENQMDMAKLQAQGLAGKISPEQTKLAMQANQMSDAHNQAMAMENAQSKNWNPNDKFANIYNPEFMKPEERKQFEAARGAWIQAFDRGEGSNRFSPPQIAKVEHDYFAQPGDTADIIHKKQMKRAKAEQDMRLFSGPAAQQLSGQPMQQQGFNPMGASSDALMQEMQRRGIKF